MAANDTPTPSTRLLRRLRQELNEALRYAQAGAEKLAECEQELAEVRRTAAANRVVNERRIAELQERLDHRTVRRSRHDDHKERKHKRAHSHSD